MVVYAGAYSSRAGRYRSSAAVAGSAHKGGGHHLIPRGFIDPVAQHIIEAKNDFDPLAYSEEINGRQTDQQRED